MSAPKIPVFKDPAVGKYLSDLTKWIDGELRGRTRDNTARGSVILVAPDGSTWSVTVDDTGTLSTTQVSG